MGQAFGPRLLGAARPTPALPRELTCHDYPIVPHPTLLRSEALHPASYPFQASWDEWGRGYGKGARGSSIAGTTKTPDVLVIRAASRAEASAALSAVAEQGEAAGEAMARDPE